MRPGTGNTGDSMKTIKRKAGGFREELSEKDIVFLDELLRTSLPLIRLNACDTA